MYYTNPFRVFVLNCIPTFIFEHRLIVLQSLQGHSSFIKRKNALFPKWPYDVIAGYLVTRNGNPNSLWVLERRVLIFP